MFVAALCIVTFLVIAAVATLLTKQNRKHELSDGKRKIWQVGVLLFVSGTVIHFPACFTVLQGSPYAAFNALALSLHNTLRVFVVDGDLWQIYDYTRDLTSPALKFLYDFMGAIIYLACPILTFSAVLSFFADITASWRVKLHPKAVKYVFSELNEKSLALANSIKSTNQKALLIFTDVYARDSEEVSERISRAKSMGAACFRKDICLFRFSLKEKIFMFLIGADENENVQQATQLVQCYKGAHDLNIYLFANSIESEMMFQSSSDQGIHIRRVHEARMLTYQLLFEDGEKLFQTAMERAEGNKVISAVVFGLGSYGTELMKALPWFGQMEGYDLHIVGIDRREDASELFTAECPELMSPQYNGTREEGEAQYHISIFDGIDVNASHWQQLMETIHQPTFVIIALGNDTLNIQTAVRFRELCERKNWHPCIQAVVQNPLKKQALEGAVNFKDQPYDICYIGDIDHIYSEANIINSELEEEALARHMMYSGKDPAEKQKDELAFWQYSYNYCSSMASALHKKAKIACGIPGADKPVEERTVEERDRLRLIEHRRWNAYTRSLGYRYSGSRDKASRNDMGKLHYDLVPFGMLSEKEKAKDDVF